MWLAQFVCAAQFFKTPKGICGHTVLMVGLYEHYSTPVSLGGLPSLALVYPSPAIQKRLGGKLLKMFNKTVAVRSGQ
jgi:hypothetical protein